MALVHHANSERLNEFKQGDHPPAMDDELTDVSSQSSEDNVDEEKSPASKVG